MTSDIIDTTVKNSSRLIDVVATLRDQASTLYCRLAGMVAEGVKYTKEDLACMAEFNVDIEEAIKKVTDADVAIVVINNILKDGLN